MLRIGDVLITIIDCNGTPLAVFTQQMEGESEEDFIARHRANVEQAKEECESGGGTSSSVATWVNADGEVNVFIASADLSDDEQAQKVARVRKLLG